MTYAEIVAHTLSAQSRILAEIALAAEDAPLLRQTMLSGARTLEGLAQMDLVVSKHALEHCADPYDKLRLIYSRLKPGGRLVMTVPFERDQRKWFPNEWNQHLFTWSPVNLGNLVHAAGFEVLSCEIMAFRFPPWTDKIYPWFGPTIFHWIARLFGLVFTRLTQVRVVAQKPHQQIEPS